MRDDDNAGFAGFISDGLLSLIAGALCGVIVSGACYFGLFHRCAG